MKTKKVAADVTKLKRGTRKQNRNRKKKPIASLSVDEFLDGGISSENEELEMNPKSKSKQIQKIPTSKRKSKLLETGGDNAEDLHNGGDVEDNSDSDEDVDADIKNHKEFLESLQTTDPELHKFLQENDQELLNFAVSDEDDDDDNDDKEAGPHKLPDSLEAASDESDYEMFEDENSAMQRKVTLKMVKLWQDQLQTDKSTGTIVNVVKAFHAALVRVSSEDESIESKESTYSVEGSNVFNAVVQLCVLELPSAIKQILKIQRLGHGLPPHKCKKWVKVKPILRLYLNDLRKLLSGVSSSHILSVLLKHIHQLTPYIISFNNIAKCFIRELVRLWSTGEETVRVISFLCILKITAGDKKMLLEKVLKVMYMSYVRNSKFVSPTSSPGINFMRRSLTELYALDESVSYGHVFLYIRQLAIHLRNAVTLMKKENIQTVYNWQFVNSLHLWVDLLGATANKPQLVSLLYPLVQIIIGTIKLVPSAQYYPLRFHCTKLLIELSNNTGTFIPVLPFLLEILTSYDFNHAHTKVSMKPMDFTCILRLSKVQLQENGFKDAIIETIYSQLLEYFGNNAHSVTFPDLAISTVIQLKMFLKSCKVANYCRKMKQLLEKVEENSKFINNERSKISFGLNDTKAIQAWESQIKLREPPIKRFFETWYKLHLNQQAKRLIDNQNIPEYRIPSLVKPQKKIEKTEESEKQIELFPSDDDDDDDNNFLRNGVSKGSKSKRGKRGSKTGKSSSNNNKKDLDDDQEEAPDIVEDFHMSDME